MSSSDVNTSPESTDVLHNINSFFIQILAVQQITEWCVILIRWLCLKKTSKEFCSQYHQKCNRFFFLNIVIYKLVNLTRNIKFAAMIRFFLSTTVSVSKSTLHCKQLHCTQLQYECNMTKFS